MLPIGYQRIRLTRAERAPSPLWFVAWFAVYCLAEYFFPSL